MARDYASVEAVLHKIGTILEKAGLDLNDYNYNIYERNEEIIADRKSVV